MYPTPPVFQLAELSCKGAGEEVLVEAKRVVSRVIDAGLGSITGGVVSYYLRKSLRNNSWRLLPWHSRAMLLALSKWGGVVRSRILREILIKVFTEIEVYSFRGRALLYGVIVAMARFRELLGDIVANARRLLTLGIQYLHQPLLYRVYG
ncbi:MAG: hypothetical protein QXP97_02455 [Desulfurococcus sp.]|uniref:hypothetical protein n=1 Tax=Desulfurococcus sp. TaxID=51678 RepID=UPI00315F55A7